MITKFEAHQDAEIAKHKREREEWKAKIIGSPNELHQIIIEAHRRIRYSILRNIAHLADAGLELNTPGYDKRLEEQTLDEVKELAQNIKQAIEKYISE